MITVVSTGFRAPTKQRCLDSVASQKGCEFVHHYTEAGDQDPPASVIVNQLVVIEELSPYDIVVLLDGDDWLIHDHVLEVVECMHRDRHAWVTYGSFCYSDGRKGFAAPLDWSKPVRKQPWVTTHLKTLRAGIFHQLRESEFEWPDGAPAPWDMVVMFAALEMVGPERSRFCPEVLSVYAFEHSHEWNASPEERAKTPAIEQEIRAAQPYSRIERL